MKLLLNLQWILLLALIASCFLATYGRRGGGGSRGGSSRGSSSRGSGSRGTGSSSGSSRTTYDRNRNRGESRPPSPPAPPPRQVEPVYKPPPPKPPSAPEVRQPAYNPNFRETSVNQPSSNPNFRGQNPPGNQQPPPYSPAAGPPPPYSPAGQPPRQGQGAPPPYSPAGQQPPYAPPGAAPPAYSPSQGVPGANYPRQPGMPQSPGVPSANYPRQPGFPPGGQGSIPGANYPKQPGVNQGGIPGGNYPNQPGVSQGGIPGGNYPRQPGGVYGANNPHQSGGIPGANYPRQPVAYPPQTLGGHVWHPQSGNPAPSYMNYGGLPTGSNMYAAPQKKKGFLGSLMGMGTSHKMGKKPKYYGSYPSPYGMAGKGGFGGGHGFSGKSAAMYTILPYMAGARHRSYFGRPRFGFMPIFLPSPFHHHHYGGYGYHGYHGNYGHTHYDVYNDEYVGRCNKPITPKNAKIMCNSTRGEVDCEVRCEEGYFYPDNTTNKENKCWHVTGVWRPTKNFPNCKPYCNVTCLNGGKCIRPGECGCPPEYRGIFCEHHFLKCDIRKLAGTVKIRWVCTHNKNETKCRIKCKAGQEFITPPPDEYLCTPDGKWTPEHVPQCVEPGSIPKNETITKE